MTPLLRVSETRVHGCWVVETRLFEDMRGTFVETWNARDFAEVGLPLEWPQDNVSSSKKDVLRGLHIQRTNPQGKLVRCTNGAILDLCLDLRTESPTFLKWHMERLEAGRALYLPPGTAHGFLALVEQSVVYYKCTTLYDRESDGGVNVWDEEIGLPHEFTLWTSIMSDKDRNLPNMRDWLAQGEVNGKESARA